jgi:O-antigen ligase
MMAGIGGLLIFSPLAIGAVNPWAFSAVEAVIFLLTVLWMARLALDDKVRRLPGLRSYVVPAALFVALILFQLVPIPPVVQRALSPSTYRIYVTSQPGWPARDLYNEMGSDHESAPKRDSVADGGGTIRNWRPLSIAPALTRTAALKLIAYGCLFFLVLFYPLRSYPQPKGERRFFRRVLKIALISGLVVGCLGLLEQAFWNGAIMWVYVPYDWGAPRPDIDPRATGPFVNPDHFAAYLNLILPLALASVMFYTFLMSRRQAWNSFRVLGSAAVAVLIAAIALSLSRGGWLGAMFAVSVVIWAAMAERWSDRQGRASGWLKVLYPLLVLCAVGGLALYTAPTAPTAVNARIEATLSEPDLGSRLYYWRDTLAVIRNFPVLGAGLGCFQDIFPRYQSPPWQSFSVRQAHNDYLELAAETGLAGLALVLWFGVAAAVRIYRGLRRAPPEVVPLIVGLSAGLAAMAFEEVFDFALQIPANAVLFTVLLALALRLSRVGRREDSENTYSAAQVRRLVASGGVAAIILMVLALLQDRTPYPYLPPPRDARSAKALILEHPARAMPHVWYAALKHGSAADQVSELAIAAALDPNNPLIRDRYAQALAANGRTALALEQLTRSVFDYPSMAEHFYLQPDMIPWLSLEERKAIDTGFRRAASYNFEGASQALAAFWAALNHDEAEADVLAKASSKADQPARRFQLLLDAGAAYVRAGEPARAAAAFRQASLIEPARSEPYEGLVTQIFAPRKDIESAKAVVHQGLQNGADPFALYLSLAQVYEQAGDIQGAESSLLQGSTKRPGDRYDYDTLMRLADLEMSARHFDRAAFWLRQAVDLRPGSAELLVQLAAAEENDYEYGQALRDLSRAMQLAPGDAGLKNRYNELLRMIAAHSDHDHSPANTR